jgi:hypothetical protein
LIGGDVILEIAEALMSDPDSSMANSIAVDRAAALSGVEQVDDLGTTLVPERR